MSRILSALSAGAVGGASCPPCECLSFSVFVIKLVATVTRQESPDGACDRRGEADIRSKLYAYAAASFAHSRQ
jgi:hypothetical protein